MSITIPAMAESLEALVAYLKADTATSAQVGTRIYGEEIPRKVSDQYGDGGAKLVLLKSAGLGVGGGAAASWLPLEGVRVDAWCFGRTFAEAREVRRAVHPALKYMSRAVVDGVLLHTAIHTAGPVSLREPDLRWPFMLETWQVTAGETLAA